VEVAELKSVPTSEAAGREMLATRPYANRYRAAAAYYAQLGEPIGACPVMQPMTAYTPIRLSFWSANTPGRVSDEPGYFRARSDEQAVSCNLIGRYVHPTFAVAFGAAWSVDPFTRRGLVNNRQEAGAVAGGAYHLDYV
jgi:hypothetical protein